MLRSSFVALALALVPGSVVGITYTSEHSWNFGCGTGVCTNAIAAVPQTAFASVSVTGPTGALSDLTPAGGWTVDGCPENWDDGSVHVTLTCTGVADCGQLFEDGGAVDTIVLLPESCGVGSFARVVSTEEITKASKFKRGPETHSVVLDYDFTAIQTDRGVVSFEVVSSDASSTVSTTDPATVEKRWSESKMYNLQPFSLDKTYNLFSTSLSCPAGFTASVTVNAEAHVHANVAVGFTVSGTIFPPRVTNAQVLGSFNGSASASITANAQASGSFDAGQVTIYQASLSSLSIPGIISVGPKFSVTGKLTGSIGGAATVTAGVSSVFPSVSLAFPKGTAATSVIVTQTKTPLVVNVDPTASAQSAINASLIPRLDVGISVLGGWGTASLFADLEATAGLSLSITGQAATGTPASANGCASLTGAMDVKLGAQGTFASFSKATTWDIYNTSVNVFNKCFTAGSKRDMVFDRSIAADALLSKRAISCPAGLKSLAPLVNA